MNKFTKRYEDILEKSSEVTSASVAGNALIIRLRSGENLLLKKAEKIDRDSEGQVFEIFSLNKDNGQRFFKTFKQVESWVKARSKGDPRAILFS